MYVCVGGGNEACRDNVHRLDHCFQMLVNTLIFLLGRTAAGPGRTSVLSTPSKLSQTDFYFFITSFTLVYMGTNHLL